MKLPMSKPVLLILAVFAVSCFCAPAVFSADKSAATAKAVGELEQAIPKMDDKSLAAAVKRLAHSKEVDPTALAAELANSQVPAANKFGLELMAEICVENSAIFDPNVFFMRFAATGKKSFPYLERIISETNDDFCREWACELYCEIYRHEAKDGAPAKVKLDALAKRADNIVARIKKLFSDPESLSSLVKSEVDLSAPFRKEWGREARMPLKLMELFWLLDSITLDNVEASCLRGRRIVDTFNYNYDILGRVAGKPSPSPPPSVPPDVDLRRQCTFLGPGWYFKWDGDKDGRLDISDVRRAFATRDMEEIKRIRALLRKMLLRSLQMSILQRGAGAWELEAMRRFDYAIWGGGRFVVLADNLITVRNRTRKGVHLSITRDNGSLGYFPDSDEKDERRFYVPARSLFVWFVPDGRYEIKLDKGGAAILSAEEVFVEKNNAEVVVAPVLSQ